MISLENLQREFARDGDLHRVTRFVDTIEATAREPIIRTEGLYWQLDRNDYAVKADFRFPISNQTERILVHACSGESTLTWVTPAMLNSIWLSTEVAFQYAFQNLNEALREANLTVDEIDNVKLGMFGSRLSFKSSLILATNAKELLSEALGWPLLAIAPDREFLYVWAAEHESFVSRVGGIVVREFSKASYPVSTEVFEISEQGVRAIGAFDIDP